MDGPPPLEDCSELLKHRKAASTRKNPQKIPLKPVSTPKLAAAAVANQTPTRKSDSSLLNLEGNPTTRTQTGKKQEKAFSGLKAGFLNNSSSNSNAKKKTAPGKPAKMETVKPKSSPLVIESVQEAVKGDPSILGASGINNLATSAEFMAKIDKSPKLAKAFTDPAFAMVAAELGQDPERAFKKYSKTRPDLLDAMQEFTKLFGAELETKAADMEAAQKPADIGIRESSTPAPKLDPSEQALVDRVLGDERIVSLMNDPAVQQVLHLARSGRQSELFKLLGNDRNLQAKMQLLQQSGLIRFENS